MSTLCDRTVPPSAGRQRRVRPTSCALEMQVQEESKRYTRSSGQVLANNSVIDYVTVQSFTVMINKEAPRDTTLT
eukprot:COSAG06_NODE_7511_length_2479_cov_8.699580_3_plen_75_part_00